MQLRKVAGLEYLLQSLSLTDRGGQLGHPVYRWAEYGTGEDATIWYWEGDCHYGTLRRIVIQALQEAGHPANERIADALILTFILILKTEEAITALDRLLSSFVSADASQYLLIPVSALLEIIDPEMPGRYEIAGLFGHGPFQYTPVDKEFREHIRYRFKRIGIESLADDLNQFFGCIAICRETFQTKLLDFQAIDFKGDQPETLGLVMQYYFDEVALVLFEDFWRKHSETQHLAIASGAPLLDRGSLESLPGTGWLTVFWDFDVLGARGMISMIMETRQREGTLALRVLSLKKELMKASERLKTEITDEFGLGPHAVCPSLGNFSRLVARSKELQQGGYVEESFTLLMVAMESLLTETEKEPIAATLSRRIGVIQAVMQSGSFDKARKLISMLYDARSRFVHQGEPISQDLLDNLNQLARLVFFVAYRSQITFLSCGGNEKDWKPEWMRDVDCIAACVHAGVDVNKNLALKVGIRFPAHGV